MSIQIKISQISNSTNVSKQPIVPVLNLCASYDLGQIKNFPQSFTNQYNDLIFRKNEKKPEVSIPRPFQTIWAVSKLKKKIT